MAVDNTNRLLQNHVTVFDAISCPNIMLKSQTLMIDVFSVTCVVIIPTRGCILVFVDMTGISDDCSTVGSISSKTTTDNLHLLLAQ